LLHYRVLLAQRLPAGLYMKKKLPIRQHFALPVHHIFWQCLPKIVDDYIRISDFESETDEIQQIFIITFVKQKVYETVDYRKLKYVTVDNYYNAVSVMIWLNLIEKVYKWHNNNQTLKRLGLYWLTVSIWYITNQMPRNIHIVAILNMMTWVSQDQSSAWNSKFITNWLSIDTAVNWEILESWHLILRVGLDAWTWLVDGIEGGKNSGLGISHQSDDVCDLRFESPQHDCWNKRQLVANANASEEYSVWNYAAIGIAKNATAFHQNMM
jgi:hypothetical protein